MEIYKITKIFFSFCVDPTQHTEQEHAVGEASARSTRTLHDGRPGSPERRLEDSHMEGIHAL